MRYEPHDFEAPTRRAELKEWLATLRGPAKPDHSVQLRAAYVSSVLRRTQPHDPDASQSFVGLTASQLSVTDDLGYRR